MTPRKRPEDKKRPGRKKGTPRTGGRKKGVPNKITADVRAALSLVIQGNMTKFARKLGQIKDPKQFCELFLKAAEFNIPKLAKVEQTVRAVVTTEQMSDAELEAIAGEALTLTAATGSESAGSRTH